MPIWIRSLDKNVQNFLMNESLRLIKKITLCGIDITLSHSYIILAYYFDISYSYIIFPLCFCEESAENLSDYLIWYQF